MSRRVMTARRMLAIATLIAAGCGEGDDRRDPGNLTGGLTSPGGGGSDGADGIGDDDDDDDDDDGGGGVKLDIGSADDGGNGTNECDELTVESELGPRDQDIVFAIDTSGSMFEEAAFVQQQMNSFSIQITAANVDPRIVLLAEYPFFVAPGVCIDPPLGSGGCPNTDSNPPEFVHVPDSEISSTDSLERLIAHYPEYSPFLRPDAVTHVVIVSDDNSHMSAADFTAQFTALDPNLVNFVLHGIISSDDPDAACAAGTALCTLAASQGTVYQELITQTGGIEGNLCDQEFQPVFQAVAQKVISDATLQCSYAIPDPPDGESFDKDQVNIEFSDGEGGVLEIGRVDDPSQCASVTHGWYYDNPDDPNIIHVCPQTCDELQGFEDGSVAIKFGCETIPAG